jgi:hypothetical protein
VSIRDFARFFAFDIPTQSKAEVSKKCGQLTTISIQAPLFSNDCFGASQFRILLGGALPPSWATRGFGRDWHEAFWPAFAVPSTVNPVHRGGWTGPFATAGLLVPIHFPQNLPILRTILPFIK